MPSYAPPQCFSCRFFRSTPNKIGGKALCTKYPKGIPTSIFNKSGNCKYFK